MTATATTTASTEDKPTVASTADEETNGACTGYVTSLRVAAADHITKVKACVLGINCCGNRCDTIGEDCDDDSGDESSCGFMSCCKRLKDFVKRVTPLLFNAFLIGFYLRLVSMVFASFSQHYIHAWTTFIDLLYGVTQHALFSLVAAKFVALIHIIRLTFLSSALTVLTISTFPTRWTSKIPSSIRRCATLVILKGTPIVVCAIFTVYVIIALWWVVLAPELFADPKYLIADAVSAFQFVENFFYESGASGYGAYIKHEMADGACEAGGSDGGGVFGGIFSIFGSSDESGSCHRWLADHHGPWFTFVITYIWLCVFLHAYIYRQAMTIAKRYKIKRS